MLITNGETRRIIDRILRKQELDRVPLWPGVDVKINTPQYMALLGTFACYTSFQFSFKVSRASGCESN
jgi:hypothetical protein